MSKGLSIAGIVIGVLGLVPWVLDMAGIGTSGALAPYLPALLDVWRVISPFALIFGGIVAGWIVRDRSKTSDAVAAARIEMEKAEHEEKMRRDREEYDAEKRAEEERLAHESMLREDAIEFKGFEAEAKKLICKAYDNGEFVMNIKLDGLFEIWACQADKATECETLPDGRFRYTLEPWMRELIDAYPELLNDTRAYLERERQASDQGATRANPERMLPHMSLQELRTLQEIVDSNGVVDFTAGFEDARFDTLEEFGMLGEVYSQQNDDWYRVLDNDVLEFFRQKENENLIAQYMSDAMNEDVREGV